MVAQFCERSLLCVNVFQITLKIRVITVTADNVLTIMWKEGKASSS